MYLHECGMLAKCLKQTKGVDAVVSDGWPKDPKVLGGGQRHRVLFRPGRKPAVGRAACQASRTASRQWRRPLSLHWGTGEVNGTGERYLSLSVAGSTRVSADWLSFPRTEKIGRGNPIFRGWDEFKLRDEIYLKTRLVPEAKPVLKVRVNEGDQVVGWTYERPNSKNGRSFGLTLGHFHDNFGLDEFRKVVANGILWTAHVDIPESGTPDWRLRRGFDIGPASRPKTGQMTGAVAVTPSQGRMDSLKLRLNLTWNTCRGRVAHPPARASLHRSNRADGDIGPGMRPPSLDRPRRECSSESPSHRCNPVAGRAFSPSETTD